MGNLLKLIPSLKEKIPTLDSLLPILPELAPSPNIKSPLTSVTVPQLPQTPPDELVLPPVIGSKTSNGKNHQQLYLFHTIHLIWNHCHQLQLIIKLIHYHWKCLTVLPLT